LSSEDRASACGLRPAPSRRSKLVSSGSSISDRSTCPAGGHILSISSVHSESNQPWLRSAQAGYGPEGLSSLRREEIRGLQHQSSEQSFSFDRSGIPRRIPGGRGESRFSYGRFGPLGRELL